MEKVELSNRLSALGHETRLKIVQALAERPEGMSSTDIAEHVGVMPTNTSSHLSVLRAAGLVSSEKKGRVVTYRLETEILKSVQANIGTLTKNHSNVSKNA
ncbi:ArsR/SmtB family transcription factor [Alteripontixanthobacter maritimus]|uniref:ArsR/SmtB family transcription factor n=1 Tax=Alteripontixanthobacter maritimus TaxID=2161824 RepID=UPI000E1C145C|nr:metalloregulator ArsR/SmtB family transcription factor [Alteripontixanthobacter maritimus]